VLLYAKRSMATWDSLPADQRAVLELVLRRGRSYEEIARMLSIDRAAVRARALAALDALGPHTHIGPERRALITDYLLGALPEAVAEQVRGRLAAAAAERAWARVVAAELETIAPGALPEIPGPGAVASPPASVGAEPRAAASSPAAASPAASPAAAAAAALPEPVAAKPGPRKPVSRVGGAIVLAVGALVVVGVVLALLLSSRGGAHHRAAAASSPHRVSTSTATTPQLLGQINLNPPSKGNAKGIAQVLREGGVTGIVILAQGLAPNSKNPPNAYAVWLYNSPADSHILGFVSPGVGSDGRLHTAGGLPANAGRYHMLLITLETRSNPKTPGPIVLEGSLAGVPLGSGSG
jgi:hypothetical protein